MNIREFLKKLFGGKQKKVLIEEIAIGTAAIVNKARSKICHLDPKLSKQDALNLILGELND